MRTGFGIAILLASFVYLPVSVLAAAPCGLLIATGDMQSPPYLWRDPVRPRHLLGANADLLRRISSELGVQIKLLDSGSWFDAQNEVRSGRVDLLVGAFQDFPEYEQYDFLTPAVWPSIRTPSAVAVVTRLVPGAMLDTGPEVLVTPAQYLAFGDNSACNEPRLRGQLSKKLAELRASGALEALLQKNLLLWNAQQLPMLPVSSIPNR
ncbi:MAG: ABC-type amino acid transport substrate-binding protein [Pseudomonas sp.]|jgi:ABC-type amino acid transport substrate-binding protein